MTTTTTTHPPSRWSIMNAHIVGLLSGHSALIRRCADVPSSSLFGSATNIMDGDWGEGIRRVSPLQIACQRRRRGGAPLSVGAFTDTKVNTRKRARNAARPLSRRQMSSPEKVTRGAKWAEAAALHSGLSFFLLLWTAFTRFSSLGSRAAAAAVVAPSIAGVPSAVRGNKCRNQLGRVKWLE